MKWFSWKAWYNYWWGPKRDLDRVCAQYEEEISQLRRKLVDITHLYDLNAAEVKGKGELLLKKDALLDQQEQQLEALEKKEADLDAVLDAAEAKSCQAYDGIYSTMLKAGWLPNAIAIQKSPDPPDPRAEITQAEGDGGDIQLSKYVPALRISEEVAESPEDLNRKAKEDAIVADIELNLPKS